MNFKISTECLINAPIDIVWKILTNFEDYKNWNPFIVDISGELQQGNQIKVTIQNDRSSKMSFNPVILENQENKELKWRGKLIIKGLFDGEHQFLLEQISSHQTKLIHSEDFSGILVRLFLKSLQSNTQYGFEQMNQALKQKSEALVHFIG
jgi:hypothetical protein